MARVNNPYGEIQYTEDNDNYHMYFPIQPPIGNSSASNVDVPVDISLEYASWNSSPNLTPPPDNNNTYPRYNSSDGDDIEPYEDGDDGSQHSQPDDDLRESCPRTYRKWTRGGMPEEVRVIRRKEQNRAAQRAFRERKAHYIKELEDRLDSLKYKHKEVVDENKHLRDLLLQLRNENAALNRSLDSSKISWPISGPATADLPRFVDHESRPSRSAAISKNSPKSKGSPSYSPYINRMGAIMTLGEGNVSLNSPDLSFLGTLDSNDSESWEKLFRPTS